MPRHLLHLLRLGSQYLEKKGVGNHRLEAEWLLADLLGISRIDLYLEYDRPLNEDETDRFREMLRRRGDGEPLQYIVGYTEFYGFRMDVRPGVLIPRPETEYLVELASERKPGSGFPTAIDLGCGSGAIVLALLKADIVEKAVGVDISPDAVRLTRENAVSLGIDGSRLAVRCEDVFQPEYRLPDEKRVDLAVSNPPYIREDEWPGLPPEVRSHEPRQALVSGGDGLDAHRALAEILPCLLNPGGLFLGEIGAEQGNAAADIHAKWAKKVTVHPDLAGKTRVIEARV